MKKTALEWLIDYIENQNKNGYEFHPKYNENIVQQAKEIEKQQIIDACNQEECFGSFDFKGYGDISKGEEYYNINFKKS